MKKLQILFFVVLFAVLLASTRESCVINRSVRDTVRSAESTSEESNGSARSEEDTDWARYKAELDKAARDHLRRQDEMLAAFLAGLEKKAPGRFNTARNAIPAVRSNLSGFKATAAMVKDLALDTTKGGNRLENRIETVIEVPFVRPLVRARESVLADCDAFAAQLEAEARAYHEEIGRAKARLPRNLRVRADAAGLGKLIERDKAVMHRYVHKAVETTIAVSLEAAFARSTVAAIREIVLIVGKKAVAKGTVTVALPFVDGPIPIGDLLAVGGAAWTAWDVHHLARVLPGKIETQLRATVDQTQRDTLAEAALFARKARDAYAASAAELGRAAVK